MLGEVVKLALTTLVMWRLVRFGTTVLARSKHTVWLAVVQGLFGVRVMLWCVRFVQPCYCASPPPRALEWWCPKHRRRLTP